MKQSQERNLVLHFNREAGASLWSSSLLKKRLAGVQGGGEPWGGLWENTPAGEEQAQRP